MFPWSSALQEQEMATLLAFTPGAPGKERGESPSLGVGEPLPGSLRHRGDPNDA